MRQNSCFARYPSSTMRCPSLHSVSVSSMHLPHQLVVTVQLQVQTGYCYIIFQKFQFRIGFDSVTILHFSSISLCSVLTRNYADSIFHIFYAVIVQHRVSLALLLFFFDLCYIPSVITV